MECAQHPGTPAMAQCVRCGRGLCAPCRCELEGYSLCEGCAAATQAHWASLRATQEAAAEPLPTIFEEACEPRDYVRAAARGLAYGAGVGLLWMLPALLWGADWVFPGLFVGLAAGLGVRSGAAGKAGRGLPWLGALTGAACVILGMALVFDARITGWAGLAPSWFLRFPLLLVVTAFSLVLNPIGLMLVFLGAWQGWRLPRRGTPIPSDFKERLLQSIPETLEFGQAYPDQYPQLDRPRLQEWTDALQEMGFAWHSDFRPARAPEGTAPSMARLFVHETEACYAELTQAFPRGAPTPLGCSVISRLGDGWQVTTSNAASDGGAHLLRRPRALWSRHPGLAIEGLFRTHLERRSLVAEWLGATPEPAGAPAFFRQLQQDSNDRRAHIQSLSVAELLRETRSKDLPLEWWGDYRGPHPTPPSAVNDPAPPLDPCRTT